MCVLNILAVKSFLLTKKKEKTKKKKEKKRNQVASLKPGFGGCGSVDADTDSADSADSTD